MSVINILALLGGLGLFLYGMRLMSDGLEAAAGNNMRRWLGVLTKNRLSGALVGTGITALVQSSSATTVMLIGFVNAGLMSLSQAVSVLMGANIGTTITAQILAFKVTDYATAFIFIGMLLFLFMKNKKTQMIGQIIAGFGILFLGMGMMSDAMMPLRESEFFIDLIANFSQPIIGILVGALFTAVIQASGATMAILIALAGQGIITLDSAVYVILGLNIGTCITAVLASIGASRTARRVAVIHVLFNVIGTLIFCLLLAVFPITQWIKSMSPGDVERQLANFHMFFNILTTLILIWIPSLLIKCSYLIVRGEDAKQEGKKLQYLLTVSKENPPVAIELSIKEISRMARIAINNFEVAGKSFIERDESVIESVYEQEDVVNYLDNEITKYLAELSQEELSTSDAMLVAELFHVLSDLERISDHAENVAEFTQIIVDRKIFFSTESTAEIAHMFERVRDALELSIQAISTGDLNAAKEVIMIEKEVDVLEVELKNHHVERMAQGVCKPDTSMVYTDLVTNMERVCDHSTNLAYHVLEGKLFRK